MAFLDNSGDIILDAVLTEIGRRKMAKGNFSIKMFALGDDEINYKLYNKNHPSGSAYYDLEILQTPILEAFTETNAGINYGLLSHGNTNLMYMPVMKTNEKVPNAAIKSESGFYYLSVADGVTADAIIAALGGSCENAGQYVLQSGAHTGTKIISEIGLDTKEISATTQNRNNYLDSNNLTDTGISVSIDTRFLSSVLGAARGSIFSNGGTEGREKIQINMSRTAAGRTDRNLPNHRIATVKAIRNQVVFRQNDNRADTATSVMNGPRASATALNFDAKSLTNDDFSRHGKTSQDLFGDGNTYDYIDTTVYVSGVSSGATQQISLRLIKKA
jgi:hypothetical protein